MTAAEVRDEPEAPRPSLLTKPSGKLELRSAEAVHYASLLAAFAILMWIGRRQWFFGDEWNFLLHRTPTEGIFRPHNEHWSTAPILIYRALYRTFGVRTYVPYLASVTIIHLVVANLLWRLLRQADVSPWLSTALVGTMLVNGAGGEDLMWAFQIGFLGALAVGLVVLLMVNEPHLSRRAEIGAIVVATFSLTWSGIAVPMVAAAAALSWMRRGLRAALRFVLVPALVYGAWLTLVGAGALKSQDNPTRRELFLIPAYVWKGLVSTVEGYTFFAGAGGVIVMAVTYLLLKRLDWASTTAAVGPTGAFAALLLYLTVAPGRIHQGLNQAGSSRYQYLAWALLLPALGVCLRDFVAGVRSRELAGIALCGAVAVYGLNALAINAENEAVREQTDRRVILAAAELTDSGQPVFDQAPVNFSPDIRPPELMVSLLHEGRLARSTLTTADRLAAAAALQVRLPPMATLPAGEGPSAPALRLVANARVAVVSPGCFNFQPQGGRPEVTLAVAAPAGIAVKAANGGELRILIRDLPSGATVDPGRPVTLAAGAASSADLAVTTYSPVLLLPATSETEVCGIQS